MNTLGGWMLSGWLLAALPARAGMTVQSLGTVSPADLAQALVGPGVTISNVTYTGISWAAGTFFGGTKGAGFDAGILLTTGSVFAAPGPNTTAQVSAQNARPGDAALTALAGVPTADAAALEFDFVPATNTVNLAYTFASDEYNEYVGAYNDAFAFELDGENVALVPGTALPVAINTVNAAANPAWFLNNDAAGTLFLDTQYDGLTRVLTVSRTVTAGTTHHMKFVVADGWDDRVDTAVFLKEASFASLTAGLVVRKTAPPFVAAGAPLTFTITVENIGAGTAFDVEAWDTVPAGTTLSVLPAPGVILGPILDWSFGDLGPGQSASVTFTVLVNGGTAAVVNRLGGCPRGGYGIGGGPPIPITAIYSEPAATSVTHVEPCLTLDADTANYAPACAGTRIHYTLHWGNCGGLTVDDLMIFDTLPAGATWVAGSLQAWAGADAAGIPAILDAAWEASPAGPWNPGEPPAGTTAPAVVRWTLNRLLPAGSGEIRYDMDSTGTPPGDLIVNAAGARVPGDPALYTPQHAILSTGPALLQLGPVSATSVEVGAPLLVTAHVRNDGCHAAVLVSATLVPEPGIPVVATPACTAPQLDPGAELDFTWTVTALARGFFSLGESVLRADGAGGPPVEAAHGSLARLRALAGPDLTAHLRVTPDPACPGVPRLVVLTVSNSGEVAADGVWPAPLVSFGEGSSTLVTGPWPAAPATVPPGGEVTFTWTVAAGPTGAAYWATTVRGNSAASGRSLPDRGAAVQSNVDDRSLHLTLVPDAAEAVCGAHTGATAVLTDACGTPLPGLRLIFAVDRGGTAIHAHDLVTDAQGRIHADLALGYDPGPNLVTVTLPGSDLRATCTIIATLPSLALATPGAALDRNVFRPRFESPLLVRLYPTTADPVVVRIYTAAGRLVRTLDPPVPVGGGRFAATWDGLSETRELVAPGVCLVAVTGGGLHETLKFVVR